MTPAKAFAALYEAAFVEDKEKRMEAIRKWRQLFVREFVGEYCIDSSIPASLGNVPGQIAEMELRERFAASAPIAFNQVTDKRLGVERFTGRLFILLPERRQRRRGCRAEGVPVTCPAHRDIPDPEGCQTCLGDWARDSGMAKDIDSVMPDAIKDLRAARIWARRWKKEAKWLYELVRRD